MIPKTEHFLAIFLLRLLCNLICQTQAQPSTYGYTCTANTSIYPCQTYVYYRARGPDHLDLASIGDLFNVSRLSISKPSNISNPAFSLLPEQGLFIPISCGCNSVRNQTLRHISFANMTYTFIKDDTFYYVSTHHYQNLTTYQSVEVVNPTLVPEDLQIGSNAYFPIFCKCPNRTQLGNQVNFLVSYVFQPSDSLDSIASKFGVTKQSIIDANGNALHPLDTVFVPVSSLPHLNQPPGALPVIDSGRRENKVAVVGLGVGLGVCVLLLVSVCGFLVYRERSFRRRLEERGLERLKLEKMEKGGIGYLEQNLLLADVSDTLDKYKVYEIDELKKATGGFDESCMIQGSVFKGCIDGKLVAIKKMKWNAYEELKILQKVNHGNLVKLEGFCIDPEDATCYLVYEFIENGSLHSWLHEDDKMRGKLNWKARLRIAIDVANGLQYIHEHTQPQVVHKDIKSSNTLLDTNMRAKIANFGLAKSGCNAITRHIVGTQGYIAPEYLADGFVSPKMDIFSFGVVLLELISGREAIDKEGNVLWMSAREVWEGKDDQRRERKLMGWADKCLLEVSCSVEGLMNMMNVAVACINRDPSKRPSMIDVVYLLCKSEDFSYDVSWIEFLSSPIKAR